MGNWHLSVQGVGPHHSGKPTDADALGKELVAKLRQAGHQITHASLHHPAADELHQPGAQHPQTAPHPTAG
jgi:hypothetical protein